MQEGEKRQWNDPTPTCIWMYSLSRVLPLATEAIAAHTNIHPSLSDCGVYGMLDQSGTEMVEWLVDWVTINSRLQFF